MNKIVLMLLMVLCGSASAAPRAQQQQLKSSTETATQRNILIPNAFTPNGDGRNDEFRLINVTKEQLLEFKIFNRWGTVMFSTTDPDQGWDGRYHNEEQPSGVYGYGIRIKYADGVVETYRGTITLIR